MLFGFSDGGGLAMYLQYKWSKIFDHAVAIDHWAAPAYESWLNPYESNYNYKSDLNAKIYTSCASFVFHMNLGYSIFRDSNNFPNNKTHGKHVFERWEPNHGAGEHEYYGEPVNPQTQYM